jgi:hypothetical protein
MKGKRKRKGQRRNEKKEINASKEWRKRNSSGTCSH